RRDWCDYARDTQGELLRIVLSDGGLDKILSYVKDRSSKLKRREIDPSKLIIWEKITRLLKDYVAKGAHITVAAQLAEKGWKIKKGDYVGYVITTGDGPLYKRAKHYTEASPEQIDTGYYVEKQVLPVCSRVTSVLGIKMKELKILVSGEDLFSYEQ
nr:hypothetical protein [Nitrososphaeria archaeon]NIN53027.1 hypothetical protein [Nitrososphaeria archaeon]NIQ33588.1 hypothetical protein [Nitrososphaeria archaeon]